MLLWHINELKFLAGLSLGSYKKVCLCLLPPMSVLLELIG